MFFLTSGPSLQVHIPWSFKNNKRQKLTQKELIGKIEGYLMKMKRTDYNYISQGTRKRHKKASRSSDSFLSLCPSLPPQFSFLAGHTGSISTSSHESALLLSASAFSSFPYIMIKHGLWRLFHVSHLQAHQPVNQHLVNPIPNGWGRRCHWVSLPNGLSAVELTCPALAKEGRIIKYNDWASVQVYLWCYEGDSLLRDSLL